MLNVTPRQRQVLEFMRRYELEHGGMPPTIDDVAEGLSISTTTAHGHVKGLVQAGALRSSGRGVRRGYFVATHCKVEAVVHAARRLVDAYGARIEEGKVVFPQHLVRLDAIEDLVRAVEGVEEVARA